VWGRRMEVTFVPFASSHKPQQNPLTLEEYAALRDRIPTEGITQRDLDRLFATVDFLEDRIALLNKLVARHRKAMRAVMAVARDGLTFGDGLNFPKQTPVIWDDMDEYL